MLALPAAASLIVGRGPVVLRRGGQGALARPDVQLMT